MASFLPVIVNENNKQTEKNISFIAVWVSHKFTDTVTVINPKKNTKKKKKSQKDFS